MESLHLTPSLLATTVKCPFFCELGQHDGGEVAAWEAVEHFWPELLKLFALQLPEVQGGLCLPALPFDAHMLVPDDSPAFQLVYNP